MNTNKIFYILVGLIVVAIFLTVILLLGNIGGSGQQKIALRMWGVFDHKNAFDKGLQNFRTQNPNITIQYQEFSYADYEKNLIDSLAANAGPDIIMVHNTWLPKHVDILTPLPATGPKTKKPLLTAKIFQDQFVDVAYGDLVRNGNIYALPLYTDTLALYYNKDMFNAAAITRPPADWQEVNKDTALLTRFDQFGNITRSGIALGTARNINRSTDLLMALMIQSGVQMSDQTGNVTFAANSSGRQLGAEALQYYTDFANPQKTTYSWNDSQHYSVDAFTEGTLAMMLGYAHEDQLIRAKAPRLNYAVAPMPQAGVSDPRNYANYWTLAVSKNSTHPNEAWEFIVAMTSKDGITDYLNVTQRPSARRDLIELQKSDPVLGIFAVQALTARSWVQKDNVVIEGVFADMIDDVNYHRFSINDALDRAQSRINVIGRRQQP